MLSIQGCNQLAAVHIFDRHDGNFEIRLQCVACGRCQRRHAHGMNRATQDEIHLDFDLDGALPNEQLGETRQAI